MNAPASPTRKLGRIWWLVFAVGFVGLLGLVWFVANYKAFRIPTGSMMPTVLPGDDVFVRMWRFGTPSPRRGDLVIFWSPDRPEVLLFSRVVGLPGDRIEIVAKHLRIDGKEVVEPYVRYEDPKVYGSGEGPIALRDNLAPATIPADRFFVLGDNRDNSNDSRFYGLISRENLLGGGEALVYFSLDPETGKVRWNRSGRRLH